MRCEGSRVLHHPGVVFEVGEVGDTRKLGEVGGAALGVERPRADQLVREGEEVDGEYYAVEITQGRR
jgi:hypothetical protein